MVAHAQRTILGMLYYINYFFLLLICEWIDNLRADILASSEVDVKVHNKCNLANVRDRTMYVIASVLDLLAIDGNKVRTHSYKKYNISLLHKFNTKSVQVERNFGDSPAVPLDAYLQRY